MDKTTMNLTDPLTEDFTMQRLTDTDELQLNFVRVKAGTSLPAHSANSNVRLVPLSGEITVTTEAGEVTLATHETTAVSFGTHMQIANKAEEDAAFLVIKTPNPRVMGG